jgi:hypothetical protein
MLKPLSHYRRRLAEKGVSGIIVSRCRRYKQVFKELPERLRFYWFHKHVFGITNTKFDISFRVFCQSFVNDQYNIRNFIDAVRSAKELFFLDIGRNHGFVFYYAMYYIMKTNFPVSVIHYYGIDPSPLKFVYFNFHDYLLKRGIKIHYHIIDRAVVFNADRKAILKYGENNFGNFNILGSNYADNNVAQQANFEYVEINVDTIQFSDVLEIIKKHTGNDAVIVKIDCKNRTAYLFSGMLDLLSSSKTNYLISCERDESGDRDLSVYARKGFNVLSASNVVR